MARFFPWFDAGADLQELGGLVVRPAWERRQRRWSRGRERSPDVRDVLDAVNLVDAIIVSLMAAPLGGAPIFTRQSVMAQPLGIELLREPFRSSRSVGGAREDWRG